MNEVEPDVLSSHSLRNMPIERKRKHLPDFDLKCHAEITATELMNQREQNILGDRILAGTEQFVRIYLTTDSENQFLVCGNQCLCASEQGEWQRVSYDTGAQCMHTSYLVDVNSTESNELNEWIRIVFKHNNYAFPSADKTADNKIVSIL